jgi:hypothetical protein
MTQRKKKAPQQMPETDEVQLARTVLTMLQSDAFVGLTWNYALARALRIELPPPKEGSELEMFIDEQSRQFADRLAEHIQKFGIIGPAQMEDAKNSARERGRPIDTVAYWALNGKGPAEGPKIGPNGVIKDDADDDEAFMQTHLRHIFK